MYGTKKEIKNAGSESILFAHKASVLLEEKSNEEALSLCEEGVKFFPFYVEGHFVLAKCYHTTGRLDDAQKEYEMVLYYLPGHLKALKALAYIYFKHEQEQEAQEVLQNFVLYDPLNAELIEFLKSKGYYKVLTQPPAGSVMPETTLTELQEEKTYTADDILSSEFDTEADDDEIMQPHEREFEEVPVLNLNGDNLDVPYDADAFKQELSEDVDIPSGVFISENDYIPEETDQDQFEINNIVDTIAEERHNEAGINLNDFDNTKDDFSTIIDDVFDKPSDEDQKKELTKTEISEASENQDMESDTEVEAEERPLLDTTIIFNEKRREDKDDNDEDDKPAVNIEQIVSNIEKDSSEKAAKIEAGMAEMIPDETSEISSDIEEMPEEKFMEPKTFNSLPESAETAKTSEDDNLEEVIDSPDELRVESDKTASDEGLKTIESAKISEALPVPEKIIGGPAAMKPFKLESEQVDKKTAGSDDEHVDIEDILSNPSLLTPTFGEILIAQRKFDDARQVFLELLKRKPDEERFKKKLNFLDKIVAMDKRN